METTAGGERQGSLSEASASAGRNETDVEDNVPYREGKGLKLGKLMLNHKIIKWHFSDKQQ